MSLPVFESRRLSVSSYIPKLEFGGERLCLGRRGGTAGVQSGLQQGGRELRNEGTLQTKKVK